MKKLIPLILLVSLSLSGCAVPPTQDEPSKSQTETTKPSSKIKESVQTNLKNKFVVIKTPHINELVESPLKMTGEIRGSWTFEGQFTIQLKDDNGKILAESPADLLDDWMTTDLVPFETTLTFNAEPAKKGSLSIIKANPSGLPENDETISFEVQF